MARPYDDDLRRKFLAAYDRGEGLIRELALRFGVSVAWGWKISAARKRTGQMERVVGRRGRPPRVTAEVLLQLGQWVKAQPDLTLVELQRKLLDEADFKLSIGRLWTLVRQLGLRLKKVAPCRRTRHRSQPKAARRVYCEDPHDLAGTPDFP